MPLKAGAKVANLHRIEFVWIRHGMSCSNFVSRHASNRKAFKDNAKYPYDAPLTNVGKQQAKYRGRNLPGPLDLILCSGMVRALQTALGVRQGASEAGDYRTGNATVVPVPCIAEYGGWSGEKLPTRAIDEIKMFCDGKNVDCSVMERLDPSNEREPNFAYFMSTVMPLVIKFAERQKIRSPLRIGIVTHQGFLSKNDIVRGRGACNAECFMEKYRYTVTPTKVKWYRSARAPKKTDACPIVRFDAVDIDACEDPNAIRMAISSRT